MARRGPTERPGVLRRDPRQPAQQRARRPRGRRRRARRRGAAGRRQHRADARTCSARSSTAPTSSSTRRPSSSAATAPTIGGVVVDGGTFDFGAHAERHPSFFEPDPSYHGLQYWPVLGHGAFAAKLRVQFLRDLGAGHPPVIGFPAAPGHRDAVAAHRAPRRRTPRRSPSGSRHATRSRRSTTPGLPSSRWYARAPALPAAGRRRGRSSFELRGGVEAGKHFVDGVELFSHLANIGDVRSAWSSTRRAPRTASSAERAGRVRRHARPGAAVGRHRGHRGPQGRPRGRLPRGKGRLACGGDLAGSASRQRCLAGGRSVGRGSSSTSGRFRSSAAGRCRTSGSPTRPGASRCAERDNAVLVLHALTGDSHVSGEADPATRPPGGGTGWSGRAGRWTPPGTGSSAPTCSAAARARPGRPSPAPDGRPWGSRFPRTTVRDQVAAELRARRRARHRRGGGSSSAARWAACARWSGRSRPRSRRRPVRARLGGRSEGRPDRLCTVTAAGRPSGPTRTGAAATTTTAAGPGPARRPGHRPAHRPPHLPQRRPSWPPGSAGGPGRRGPARRRPLRGGVLPRPPADKLVRRFDAGSYVALDRGDEHPRRRTRERRC